MAPRDLIRAGPRVEGLVMSRDLVVKAIQDLGVVAVIRMRDPGRLRAVVDALAEGGVRAIEVTMTVPDAVALIAKLASSLPSTLLLGAGTVTDAAMARAVIDAARGSSSGRCSAAMSSTRATHATSSPPPGASPPPKSWTPTSTAPTA